MKLVYFFKHMIK